VAILDLSMPVMDGVSFLTRIRATPEWHDLRVIVFTADDKTKTAFGLFGLGVSELMFKGTDSLDHLLAAVGD
jgi:CheY-like chemotaxis protein